MRAAIFLLAILPFVFSASVRDRRFIESITGGGYNIRKLSKQLLAEFGTMENEHQCENQLCPQIMNPIDHHNSLVTSITCAAICKEAQVLSKHYTHRNDH